MSFLEGKFSLAGVVPRMVLAHPDTMSAILTQL